jgi:hypothetical protein
MPEHLASANVASRHDCTHTRTGICTLFSHLEHVVNIDFAACSRGHVDARLGHAGTRAGLVWRCGYCELGEVFAQPHGAGRERHSHKGLVLD